MKDFQADDDVEDEDEFDDGEEINDEDEAALQEVEDYDPTEITGGVAWCARPRRGELSRAEMASWRRDWSPSLCCGLWCRQEERAPAKCKTAPQPPGASPLLAAPDCARSALRFSQGRESAGDREKGPRGHALAWRTPSTHRHRGTSSH